MRDGGEEGRPKHSPLGASGAERWMACPGSILLLQLLVEQDDAEEPEYTREGTAAHDIMHKCLTTDVEPWEFLGQEIEKVAVTDEMTDAVQLAVDHVRSLITPIAKTFFEYPISSPVHPLFYGTLDVGILYDSICHIADLKYGKGIVVEAVGNKQMRYYGFGLVQHYPDVQRVIMHIMQPRAPHEDGPIRTWEVPRRDLDEWVYDELVPAMQRAGRDGTLCAGSHCRFCPAKLICPALSGLFNAAATYNPKAIVSQDDVSLGQSYAQIQAVKFYLKALEEEAFRRARKGNDLGTVKLVHKKANRVFQPGAASIFTERYGDLAFTEPSLKSPAEMEKIDAAAKALVHEHAFTPTSDLTLAPIDDKRPAVKIMPATEVFAGALESLQDDG